MDVGTVILTTLGVLSWVGSLNCIWAVARRHERRVQTEYRQREALTYVCSCSHGFGLHYDDACHGRVREPTGWDYTGNEITWQLTSCPCQLYAGIVPAEYVLPNLLQPGVDRAGDDAPGTGGGARHGG